MSLIFVDCEAFGGAPAVGQLTEFGAVAFEPYRARREWITFHGVLVKSVPSPEDPAVPTRVERPDPALEVQVYMTFAVWLKQHVKGRPIFVSDNPAFDFQWINDGFWRTLGENPFGHSARRISDFYAGLRGDFYRTQEWKRFRVTPHDHNPVHDAMGNVEAFVRLLEGER